MGVDTIFRGGGGDIATTAHRAHKFLICLELWQLSIFNVTNAFEESTEHS